MKVGKTPRSISQTSLGIETLSCTLNEGKKRLIAISKSAEVEIPIDSDSLSAALITSGEMVNEDFNFLDAAAFRGLPPLFLIGCGGLIVFIAREA